MTEHSSTNDGQAISSTVHIKTPTERAREASKQTNITNTTTSPSPKAPAIRVQIERRITEKLILHWQEKRKGADYPNLDDFNIEEIEELWDDCMLGKVTSEQPHDKNDVYYDHIGRNIMNISGLSDDESEQTLLFIHTHLCSSYHQVFHEKRPCVEESTLTNLAGQELMYRQIILPLGDEDGMIKHIIVGLRFKAVQGDH